MLFDQLFNRERYEIKYSDIHTKTKLTDSFYQMRHVLDH